MISKNVPYQQTDVSMGLEKSKVAPDIGENQNIDVL
jgi:hypothetical protein